MGNLATPISVQKLQLALHAKAKAEAGYRFYALYDKLYREDILAHAYDHIEDAVVWGIVTEQLPRFLQELESIPGIDPKSPSD